MSSTEARRRAGSQYLNRGIAVLPVPAGDKISGLNGWQDLRLTEADVPKYWTIRQNTGVLNGESSSGRVFVDIDVSEALVIADKLFPPNAGQRSGEISNHSFLQIYSIHLEFIGAW